MCAFMCPGLPWHRGRPPCGLCSPAARRAPTSPPPPPAARQAAFEHCVPVSVWTSTLKVRAGG